MLCSLVACILFMLEFLVDEFFSWAQNVLIAYRELVGKDGRWDQWGVIRLRNVIKDSL